MAKMVLSMTGPGLEEVSASGVKRLKGMQKEWERLMMRAYFNKDESEAARASWVLGHLRRMEEVLSFARNSDVEALAIEWARRVSQGKGARGKTNSKADLAARCGVNRAYLSLFLNGKAPKNGFSESVREKIVTGIIQEFLKANGDASPKKKSS